MTNTIWRLERMREYKGHNDLATFDAPTVITRITSSNESGPNYTTGGEGRGRGAGGDRSW